MQSGKFVAYYRVSTVKQGASGLGLEAQKQAVQNYLNGGPWDLVAEFTEIESGKRNDRAELAAALELCKREKAKLVIAKLDRLARNVHFVSGLMESGVDFVAVDFPEANRLTIHILAAVAEHEARMASDRTKAALAEVNAAIGRDGQYRTRAGRTIRTLGNTVNLGAAAEQSRIIRSRTADIRAANVQPIVREIKAAGITDLRGIARTLNARGVQSPRGGRWYAASVARAMAR